MPPANDLVFCDIFENAALFKRIIRAVIGKKEKVELIEPPLSQVAYKNPGLSSDNKKRLGSIRVDVQAEGIDKLFSLDMQQIYNESTILKRVVFYSFRMYTNQIVKDMRYDELKPACVTFIMAESLEKDKKYKKLRLTVFDEITGRKYFDILDSYLVFIPNVIKNSKSKNSDLYVFSAFLSVATQQGADEFERDYGAKPLGKELIRLYAETVKNKKRLYGIKQFNYYFTEKEYERVKLEDNKKHAEEMEKQCQETEKQRQEAERQRKEAEKQAKQLYESAVNFILSGTDIAVVSKNTGISISDLEKYMADKENDKSQLPKE